MPFYETVFMSRQDVSSSQVEKLTEDFTNILKENGGKVVSVEQWGLRTLAYRVKKNRKAHYTMMNIEAPAAAKDEMERQMGLNEDILRQLTLKVDELSSEPSIIMSGGKGKYGKSSRKGKPADSKSTENEKGEAA